jgi:hypothetical protein
MPVFARAGAVVVTQEYRPLGNVRPPERLVVDAYPGRRGAFTLYEDRGDGLDFRSGRFARTRFGQRRAGRTIAVTLGRARGRFFGRATRRDYELRVRDAAVPRAVTVGRRRLRRVAPDAAARGWWYEASSRTVFVRTGPLRTGRAARIVLTRSRG